jgi:hypothetical protein
MRVKLPPSKPDYTIQVMYNPPGFHPVTVIITNNRCAKEENGSAEFNGRALAPLLKQAAKWTEER